MLDEAVLSKKFHGTYQTKVDSQNVLSLPDDLFVLMELKDHLWRAGLHGKSRKMLDEIPKGMIPCFVTNASRKGNITVYSPLHLPKKQAENHPRAYTTYISDKFPHKMKIYEPDLRDSLVDIVGKNYVILIRPHG
jgi:hypothetical protein